MDEVQTIFAQGMICFISTNDKLLKYQSGPDKQDISKHKTIKTINFTTNNKTMILKQKQKFLLTLQLIEYIYYILNPN